LGKGRQRQPPIMSCEGVQLRDQKCQAVAFGLLAVCDLLPIFPSRRQPVWALSHMNVPSSQDDCWTKESAFAWPRTLCQASAKTPRARIRLTWSNTIVRRASGQKVCSCCTRQFKNNQNLPSALSCFIWGPLCPRCNPSSMIFPIDSSHRRFALPDWCC
jgi:hypothetical protein